MNDYRNSVYMQIETVEIVRFHHLSQKLFIYLWRTTQQHRRKSKMKKMKGKTFFFANFWGLIGC